MLKYRDKFFYGWVVVASFLIISIALYGVHSSFGLFFKSIQSEFELTRTVTSAIVSTNLVLAGIAAFGAGWALDRYGAKRVVLLMGMFTGLSLILTSQVNASWQLFITYSLLLSLGTGAVFVVITSAVAKWFERKRGLALGIAGSGSGLGMVLMAPFAAFLISNFDWRTAYLIVGLIAWLGIVPISGLLRNNPDEVGALPYGVLPNPGATRKGRGRTEDNPTAYSFSWLLRFKDFWFAVSAWIFLAFCVFFVYTHLVPHITDMGFSSVEAAGVLSVLGGVSIAGKILMGAMCDRIGSKPTALFCSVLQAGAIFWMAWIQEIWIFYLTASIFGFAFGGSTSALGAFIADVFGSARIGTVLGLLEIGFGIGASLGPLIGGLIFDIKDSYLLAFIIAGIAMLMVAFFVILIGTKGLNLIKG